MFFAALTWARIYVQCIIFVLDASISSRQDVHAPAANLTELKKTEALREKMAVIREKRRVNALLGWVLLLLYWSYP